MQIRGTYQNVKPVSFGHTMNRATIEQIRDTDPCRTNTEPMGTPAKGARRSLLLVGGSLSLLLAVIGAILPVMPTTPFLLASLFCFARSSRRCHMLLINNRLVGRYLAHVAQGRRLPPPIKIALVASSWMTAAASALLLAPTLPLKLVSLSMAAAMSAYILLQGRGRVSLRAARDRGASDRPASDSSSR